jgi:lambda family phage portal protein
MLIRDSQKDEAASRPGFLERCVGAYDRVLQTFAPQTAARNMYARMQMSLASEFMGGYDGADRSSREMSGWAPFGTDADSSMSGLDDLRSRSRDAVRNQPLAGGAINTTVMNTVGIGLTLQSRIDRELLNLSDAEAEAWQKHTERRYRLWANSKDCDLERKLSFNGHTQLALRNRCVNGESIVLLPIKELPGLSNPLRLQAVESDRLCNPNRVPDSKGMVGGVEKDEDGAPKRYWIMRSHPGNILYADSSRWQWDPYDAFNPKTGLRNVLHYYRSERAGQSRGIPMLAPVLEPLKDISRMSKAELKRAVVSALFTVFIKSNGQPLGNMPFAPGAQQQYGGMTVTRGPGDQSAATTGNIKLGAGAVVELGQNQEIQLADPKLPNPNFDPFFQANVRQIGLQIGIPFEVLIKHYTASYSAARAAIEDAWNFFLFMRAELVEEHCNPIYAVWLAQEVAQGTIYAPGFFADPMIRAAWLGCEWIGPNKPIINPVQEVDAAERRAVLGITTLAQETAAMNGGDWDTNIVRRGQEEKARAAAGLSPTGAEPPQPPAPPAQNPDLPEAA